MDDTKREVLTGSSSAAVDEAEAEFRRKAWLALAPLYGDTPFSGCEPSNSSAAVDEAEAEFRRKAWLALAPLYGVPPFAEESSNDAV